MRDVDTAIDIEIDLHIKKEQCLHPFSCHHCHMGEYEGSTEGSKEVW
jgi:hypothetical protein